jgi:hypothetical protein
MTLLLFAAAALAAAALPPATEAGTAKSASPPPRNTLANLPIDSRVYDDIDLLKTSGLISSMPPTSRPWTLAEAARLAREAETASLTRRTNAAQRAALKRLQIALGYQMGSVGRRPLLQLGVPGTGGAARFDLFSRAYADRTRWTGSAGTVLDNLGGDNFAYYDRIEVGLLRPLVEHVRDSSGIHLPARRIQSSRDGIAFDMEHAYAAFRLPWVRLEFGRDEFYWGPAHVSSVMLDDSAPSLNHLQFCASYPGFKFLAFTAYLSRWGQKPRFLCAQRLEVSFWNRITLGGGMMSVTSWDELQPAELAAFMNPLLPIYFVTTTSGHGDNLLVGWDAALYLPYSKVYGQVFIDNYEFNARRDAPNAVGLQTGCYVTPALPLELRAEYARVAPFTYYHRIHSIIYENWQVPLGHDLGPDADQTFASARWTPTPWLRLSLCADHTRRGFYNRGDYLRKSFYHESPENHTELPEEFPSDGITADGDTLGPDWQVEKTTRIGPRVELNLVRDLYLVARADYWTAENHAGLPDSAATGIDASVKLEYRY